MATEDMRVLSPVELIRAYIDDSNPNATELDFKRALDLLQYCNEDEVDTTALRMNIW